MNKIHCLILLVIVLLITMNCSKPKKSMIVSSPDNLIHVKVMLDDSAGAFYEITAMGRQIMKPSKLGIVREDEDFSKGLRLLNVSEVQFVKDQYNMLHGKKQNYLYEANKIVYQFENANQQNMDIIFQVSNDGIAFRYFFPDQSTDLKKIEREETSFHFTDNTKAWIQPRAKAKSGWNMTNPSYEEFYIQDSVVKKIEPAQSGWVFPALFKEDKLWMLVSETAPNRDYCASRLLKGDNPNEFVLSFPEKSESIHDGAVNPQSTLPWQSPWRIIAIGSLETIVESTLGTDIAKPSVLEDISYVKPGRASWSWVLLKDDSTIYEVQKRFIDYAAAMTWEYCLIDANWDTMIGYEKVNELAGYAAEKNVGLLLWYNSAGDWNTVTYHPRNLLLSKESRAKEFSRIKKMGIKGIKVDFFGGDGQSVITYYQDILEDAAKYELMVNFHGSTIPRGWHRTYPNLLTMEAVKGFEFVTFDQQNANSAANHCAILPFTRNVFDPMDYTPVCFSEVPNINRTTTNAFELALAVLFNSGIQHYAEKPQGMFSAPRYVQDLMKKIPVSWEDTEFIDGYPGKFVVMARKANGIWYIAGINGEEFEKDIEVRLPFISNSIGTLITDGANNRSFIKKEMKLDSSGNILLTLKGNGGFILIIEDF